MRVIIVGGPRTGKSTLARSMRGDGLPTYCGDPASKAKQVEDSVTYLPEHLEWSDGSQWVADQWFTQPGPWVCEGQIMARALRKWTQLEAPADRVIVLTEHHPLAIVSPGQAAMHKGVMKVWREIAHRFEAIAEYRGAA